MLSMVRAPFMWAVVWCLMRFTICVGLSAGLWQVAFGCVKILKYVFSSPSLAIVGLKVTA
jgi:hypothetical protein